MRLKVPFWVSIGLFTLAALALALIRYGGESTLACATSDQTWLNLDFMVDEGHADVILLLEPRLFSGSASESFSDYVGDSDISIEVRDRQTRWRDRPTSRKAGSSSSSS